MTSLLDIGPLTEDVNLGAGQVVSVHGVTPEGFFYLLAKFPMLQMIFGGKAKNVDMGALQAAGPTCVAHAIAVSTTDRSKFADVNSWNKAIEAAVPVALSLSAHHQMLIFNAALRLTFPDGIGPFMVAMEGLADSINRVSGSQSGPGRATTSSKRSRSGFTTDSRSLRLGRARQSASSVH